MFYGMFMTQLKFSDTTHENLLTKDKSPWFERKNKVVMLIIDGLRVDYLLDFENLEHIDKLKANKFKRFNRAYAQDPEKYVAIRSIVDVPTLTILRIPCLMTGNVPRKAGVMTSFKAMTSQEDSIPRQLQLEGKKVFYEGDPNLYNNFPEYFKAPKAVGEFDMNDPAVDEIPKEFIKQTIADKDFDFLVAHLLRVDHVAHAFHDLTHPIVEQAIDEMDLFLQEVINSIDDDTILIFGGDHGGSIDGRHGDGTPQVTNTMYIAYHKNGWMKYKQPDTEKVMRSINETKSVKQVDIVPTLSMLMGIPIPFSNMGQIMSDFYPAGYDYPSTKSCPDVAFEMQMLRDNYLNGLQIRNYFKKYQDAVQIFSGSEYRSVTDLAKEIDNNYEKAQELINNPKECEQVRQIALDTIKNTQELSDKIYDLVNSKLPFQTAIFTQGFLLLLIVTVAYILIVQYILMTKDYDYITLDNFKDYKAIVKFFAPLLISLFAIWIVMCFMKAHLMDIATISVFFVGVFAFGALVLLLPRRKRLQHNELQNLPSASSASSVSQSVDESREFLPAFSFKSLFLFQNPRFAFAAFVIFVVLFYQVHVFNIDREKLIKYHSLNPYAITILAALLFHAKYPGIRLYYTLGAAVALCTGLYLVNIYSIWSETLNKIFGLLLIADWIWNEIQFSAKKLGTSKTWGYQYLLTLTVLAIYHLIPNRFTNSVQIILPRVVWTLLAGSIIASFLMKMGRKVIKRNLQTSLILLMVLLQDPVKLLYFAFVLTAMRITTEFFKRTSFKNYLYPLILALMGYIGLFMIDYTDRIMPNSFAAAFVGLKDFHIILGIAFYGIAMLSTVILPMLFISYFHQDLKLEQAELGVQTKDFGDIALKDQATIVKKRNLILYIFFYATVMISAALKIFVYRNDLGEEGVMEKYIVDAFLYGTVMISAYCTL